MALAPTKDRPNEVSPLLEKGRSSSNFQIGILVVAMFLKGGLLGAYIPFSSLWLSKKGYSARDLGMVATVDAAFSLMLPTVGTVLDKLRAHNIGFTVLLVILATLKYCYIPAASNFALIILLSAFTAPLLRASNSILDALALYSLEDKNNFTRMRLTGDLGFGFISLGVGAALHHFKNEDVIFYLFSMICLSLAFMWFVSAPYLNIRADSNQMTREEFCAQLHSLKRMAWNREVIRGLIILWIVGCTLGLISTFEFILLDRLMGNGILLGLCKLVGTFAAIPVWWYVPHAMDYVGFKTMQLIGLTGAGIRLVVLGVIKNPWHALFSEAFAGVGGFAIAYGTLTVLTGRNVDEDMKGTVQTALFAIFTGLGAGGSPLVGGFVVEWWGIQFMFFWTGMIIFVVVAVLTIMDLVARYALGSYRHVEDVLQLEKEANTTGSSNSSHC